MQQVGTMFGPRVPLSALLPYHHYNLVRAQPCRAQQLLRTWLLGAGPWSGMGGPSAGIRSGHQTAAR